MELIEKILNGEDVHQATADMFHATRDEGKTLNFSQLYGQGAAQLAKSLNCGIEEAKRKKQKYFLALKRVQQLISAIKRKGEGRGYISNWKGRRMHLNDKKFSYQLPNHLIQGGCADVLRQSMNENHEFLKDKKSAMLIQVHDELLFEVHKDELHIVDDLKRIMENVYTPRNGLNLTCSVEHSWISWADKVEGHPSGN
jgi:DNA polymerase-1